MASLFDTLQANAFRAGIKARTRQSRKWFQANVKNLQVSRPGLLADKALKKTAVPVRGSMYMYFYDPKYKATLPYYDRFPLTVLVNGAPGGFYGLNLHYIPPRDRAILMDSLNKYATNDRYDRTTRLNLSYQLLKRFGRAVPCVKRYLGDHVVSETVRIDADEWEIAIFLPVERFQKESARTVWKDSRRFY